jgi:hypothetical protein
VMIASAERSGIALEFGPEPPGALAQYRRDRQRMRARIDEMRRAARPDPALDAELRSALQMTDAKDGYFGWPTPSERTRIFEGAHRLVVESRSFAANRRAAALFVADQLIGQAGGPFWKRDDQPAIADTLAADGAEFQWSELADGYSYRHSWLKLAREIDPSGRAGELAFLTLMEMGFETGNCTDQHGEGFRAVIASGEAFLRERPRSAIAGDVRILVAQAYGDIVALAAGAAYDEDESRRYLPEASGARERAIALFRDAFNRGEALGRARAAWPDAWRLAAGLAPSRTFFYCIYD